MPRSTAARIALRMPHIASRIFGTPLACEPNRASAFIHAIGARVTGVDQVDVAIEPGALMPVTGRNPETNRGPLTTIADGVAVMDIVGTLVHRGSWLDAECGLVSYQQIATELRAALADPRVHSILMVIDSGGGEVAGLNELAQEIYEARATKTIVAIASDMAASAAYLLGSAAEQFYASEGAITGSIGVVWAHVDQTAADEEAGVKVTLIHAGARKVDGNPHQTLSDEARQSLETTVAAFYDKFVEKVSAFRGISADAIRATEARVYVGAHALQHGLVDGIKSTREVLESLKAGGAAPAPRNASGAMVAPGNPPLNAATEVQVDHEKKAPEGAPAAAGADSSQAEVLRLQKELEKANARIAIAESALSESKESAKAELIQKAQLEGRVTPRMLASVQKYAAMVEPKELGEYLAGLPQATHPKADGRPDVDEKPESTALASTPDDKRMLMQLGVTDAALRTYGSVKSLHANGTVVLLDGTLTDVKSLQGRA